MVFIIFSDQTNEAYQANVSVYISKDPKKSQKLMVGSPKSKELQHRGIAI